MSAIQKTRTAVRFNVGLSRDNYTELCELATKHKMSMPVFVRNAIQVYHHLLVEMDNGRSIYSGLNDKADKELVIPLSGS